MSEQSGGGHITREQVERAIPESLACHAQGINAVLGALWYQRHDIPEDVIAGWNAIGYRDLTAALTRWRDELAAAEPVRRVARWDADLEAYTLTPTHDDGALMTHAVEDAAKARAWGYTIEGGPEPIDDTAPERLRERREALGWTTAYAGHWVPWFDHTDVERAECGRGVPAFVARYAAALSAEEARRAEEERLACAYRESDGTLVWDDSPLPEPERPAPRFKVGDWVRDGSRGFRVAEMHWDDSDVVPMWYARAAVGVAEGIAESSLESYAGPASPPAPEVVDVPQPRIVVKRCDEVEAEWTSADATILIVTHDALDDAIFVPIALLRAMLEAIDAQQQPDPQPDLDEGWRIVSGDTAFAMPFGTIRECSGCGCLVSGGPTACLRCIDAQQADAARDLTDMIRRLRAAEARTAWQPIETAPRDGTAVLVWWLLSTSDAGGIACFNGERWTQRDGLPYTWAPTHWMPLPAAPEAP